MPKTQANKQRRVVTSIERMGYDVRVEELYREGKSIPQIHAKLTEEGKIINIHTLRHYLQTHYLDEKRDRIKKKKENLETLDVENPSLKLLDAIKEAMKNYESCKDPKSGNLKPGREKEALEWHKLYNDLLEKWLKAAGIYEKAKQEAGKEEDKRIEVYWVFQYRCSDCGKMLEQRVLVNNTTSVTDQQTERIKEEITEQLEKEVQLNDSTGEHQDIQVSPEP